MSDKSIAIENLLKELRKSFIAELPSRLDELENDVLSITPDKANIEKFEKIYRAVHSLKGSAGTHGLPVLSTICHNLEDKLSDHSNNLSSIDPDEINLWLQYIDLLRKALTSINNNETDFKFIDLALDALRNSGTDEPRYRCLLVGPSQLQKQICQTIFSEKNIDISIVANGYEGLGRLLAERYDFIVTNHETSQLNGIAMVSAIRTSNTRNKDILSVLLTTNQALSLNRQTDPDYILLKNSNLPENLSIIVDEIMNELSLHTR